MVQNTSCHGCSVLYLDIFCDLLENNQSSILTSVGMGDIFRRGVEGQKKERETHHQLGVCTHFEIILFHSKVSSPQKPLYLPWPSEKV